MLAMENIVRGATAGVEKQVARRGNATVAEDQVILPKIQHVLQRIRNVDTVRASVILKQSVQGRQQPGNGVETGTGKLSTLFT